MPELLRQFDRVTALWVNGPDCGLDQFIGRRVGVVVDCSTPQVATLVQVRHDARRGGAAITLAEGVAVPSEPWMPRVVTVLDPDDGWRRIAGPAAASHE